MSRFERSIKLAFDKTSGEILEADKVFSETKESFQIRKQFHENKLNLSCCECEQELMVSGSKFDRLHFKHKPGHSFCILSDGQLTPKEQDVFTKILKNKESERHIELKNKIGNLLKDVDGVDLESIAIDNKFIIRNGEKRRPDVFCNYKGNDIVFEIQLSELSLGYILSRYEFYKKNQMFLIWILDDFDIHNQGTLERDIKYLTEYENFFKLDESSNTLKLLCEYKYPFLTDDNRLLTKWLKKPVSLSQLQFDTNVYQVFYYNFGNNKTKTEKKQKVREAELLEIERQKQEELRLNRAKDEAHKIINCIKHLRKNKHLSYDRIRIQIEELYPFELKMLNEILGLKERETPIIKWIEGAKRGDYQFIEFLIDCEKIEKDLNEMSSDDFTAFQAIIDNDEFQVYEKKLLLKRMLEYGYTLKSNDLIKLENLIDNSEEIFLFEQSNALTNRRLTPNIFEHSRLIFIVESAKRRELIGYKYPNNIWIQLANTAIEYYKDYWDYIESAFKHYEIWDKVEKADTKGKFSKKLQNYYLTMPEQNYELDELINELYPEIYET
jgi:hypothetical protein